MEAKALIRITKAERLRPIPVRAWYCLCGQYIGWELTNRCLQVGAVWFEHGSTFRCCNCKRRKTWRIDGEGSELADAAEQAECKKQRPS